MFSVSLVTLDSYQAAPVSGLDVTFSDFRGTEIKHVPVIRIFGSTPSGIKTCLHIHGVFPYIYIPCAIENNVDSFMYKLAAAIDSAINVSLGSAFSKSQHVYKIQRVSGIPLYGYHEKEHLFFKIYFYNPAMVKRAADLLQNGTILNQNHQPYEAHIPFILQFMMDYNLYGMSLINLKIIKYRQRITMGSKENSQNESLSNSDSQIYLPASVIRQSTCKLEVDAQATEILNREEIQNGLDLNPGIAAIWNDEKCRRVANGLQQSESQLLYTNTNDRVYGPTNNDIYQEQRLIQRLQTISQMSETVASVTPSVLTYPLEVEMDTDDMQLVEMLVNLAESNEDDIIVDDDSVLASQYSALSNEIKEDNEDEEIEDLNITSLDLDSLSSWNTVSKTASQSSTTEITNGKEKSAVLENDTEDISLLNFPQFDGSYDLFLENEKQLQRKPLIHTIEQQKKSKRRKGMQAVKRDLFHTYSRNAFNAIDWNHQDLDVYDLDELDHALSFVDHSNSLYTTDYDESRFTSYNLSMKPKIPAFDGNAVDSSSDSELDQDITIDREEKRICVYKSCGKSKNEQNIVNVSFKKRKLEFEDTSLQSPQKHRHISSESSQSESHRTPTKVRGLQSPRSLSGRYSPLNVTVISPKAKINSVTKDSSRNEPCSSKSLLDTPKRNRDHLRMNLLREKIRGLPSGMKQVCFTQDNTEIVKEFVDSEVAEDNTSNSKYVKHITPKSNKEVRKRLSFLNANDNEIDSVKDNIDEKHSEHLSLTEKILNKSHENDDSAVASVTNFTYDQNFIKICTKENEKVNCDNHLPSTSGNNTDLCIGNLSGKVLQENEEENIVDEDEKDICNMTYMQLLNKKLESEIENSSFLSLDNKRDITKNKLITITTKFNPPTRERIMNTAKTYDISGCKSSGPFFSNKVDLIKHKESSNRTNDIGDLVPFKSSLDRVTGIKLWRRVKINEFYPSGSNIKSCDIKRVLTGHSSIVIESLIQPPTSKSVTTWLQAKQYLAKRNNTGTEVKNRPNIEIAKVGEENVPNVNCNENVEGHVSTAIKNTANETFIGTEQPKQLSQTSNTSHCSNGSNLNPSLRQMLENPLLYKDIDSQQHLGISYGQIEYSMKGDSGNVADENFQNAKGITVHQYLTIFSLEVHVITRDKLLPDPEHDSMGAIFYAIYSDVPSSSDVERIEHGAIVVTCSTYSSKIKNIYSTSTTCPTSYVSSEEDLLNSLITLIRHSDPDILIGWEIESHSWGYIMQRATHIGYNNLTWQISRIPNVTPTKGQTLDKDNLSDVKIPGRIVLDVWRIMRHEIGLLNYTFENVIYHVLRERIACPTFQHLTDWWKHNNVTIQWRVIFHYVVRVVGTLRILIHLDIIGRTCEHARLFGIQFYEVFSRGSQFRVESMMLRLAKPLNYVPISPSVHQRARMRAPESLPLIMEPQSVFYTDPLIVLDFQSLYPSIIIAYNYCYSTCLGRIEHIGQSEPYEFGAATLKLKGSTIRKLQGKMNFSPCGVAFVTPEVRLGILPRMLAEILNTRLMVKGSMKLYGNENRVLQRVLHSQQLGLKLIANVTYGYTSANFSGRMPCIEIGDSVVSKGRETLERAIKIVESTPKWGARVVYGDTDSLFILLPGKSREDAFTVGAEIADTVTAANPPPVKLKFEKVLQPAILQTKKRYCGYMYESVDQKEPKYLAKGIETVRRDGCPAATKILEKSLKILFDTKDLSLLKLYVTRQFDKILRRKISIQDLTFAREFRGLQGYKASACVPALELTRRLMRKDPRAIPRVGERVRYVIVAGAPNQPLIHCVRTPMEVISDEGLNTNSVYYITKVIIPPLNRCLNLIGIDVHTWYREMSHRQTPDKAVSLFTDNQKQTIRQFFSTVVCAACGDQTQKDICTNCVSNPSQTVTILHEKMRWLERSHSKLTTICQSCIGYLDDVKCESLDCPIFYRLTQARRDLVQIPYLDSIICNRDIFFPERRNVRQ
ncbi:PREDICTED: DNA polymerase zeta catalytic subunit [Dufourea novaeangliae]|uniref:DNA polymerase zeta catalytic subunit n=1 Tax=Dufourea novaeangliae TaxID=178035 RepID=UPI00076791FE|nr:PREDICTED: DNA polymerase zeta catalytic subunit [Dufourea novaeangliae]